MTEVAKQVKDYEPASGQRIWCGFHEADFEKEYELLQITDKGIVVTPITNKKKRVFFIPYTSLDYFAWYPKEDSQEAKQNV